MNWKRITGYGIVIWLIPFVISVLLFSVRENNRALFESLITVIGVACAVTASLLYFRDQMTPNASVGLKLGIAWAVISVIMDLPIFLGPIGMSLPAYASDIALSYLSFPVITVGIALARHAGHALR